MNISHKKNQLLFLMFFLGFYGPLAETINTYQKIKKAKEQKLKENAFIIIAALGSTVLIFSFIKPKDESKKKINLVVPKFTTIKNETVPNPMVKNITDNNFIESMAKKFWDNGISTGFGLKEKDSDKQDRAKKTSDFFNSIKTNDLNDNKNVFNFMKNIDIIFCLSPLNSDNSIDKNRLEEYNNDANNKKKLDQILNTMKNLLIKIQEAQTKKANRKSFIIDDFFDFFYTYCQYCFERFHWLPSGEIINKLKNFQSIDAFRSSQNEQTNQWAAVKFFQKLINDMFDQNNIIFKETFIKHFNESLDVFTCITPTLNFHELISKFNEIQDKNQKNNYNLSAMEQYSFINNQWTNKLQRVLNNISVGKKIQSIKSLNIQESINFQWDKDKNKNAKVNKKTSATINKICKQWLVCVYALTDSNLKLDQLKELNVFQYKINYFSQIMDRHIFKSIDLQNNQLIITDDWMMVEEMEKLMDNIYKTFVENIHGKNSIDANQLDKICLEYIGKLQEKNIETKNPHLNPLAYFEFNGEKLNLKVSLQDGINSSIKDLFKNFMIAIKEKIFQNNE
jgi:hypothetical protein